MNLTKMVFEVWIDLKKLCNKKVCKFLNFFNCNKITLNFNFNFKHFLPKVCCETIHSAESLIHCFCFRSSRCKPVRNASKILHGTLIPFFFSLVNKSQRRFNLLWEPTVTHIRKSHKSECTPTNAYCKSWCIDIQTWCAECATHVRSTCDRVSFWLCVHKNSICEDKQL